MLSRIPGKPLQILASQPDFDREGLSEVQNITFKYLPSGESLVYEDRSSQPMGQAYRVVSPFIAFQSTADGHKTITLPVGCEIRICGAAQKSGLVDVDLAGKIVAVFMRDIDARAERVA